MPPSALVQTVGLAAMDAAQSGAQVVATTLRVWPPLASHLRRCRSDGASGAAVEAAVRALGAPDHRWPIPAADPAAVRRLDAAGRALNEALRARYARGDDAGPLAGALDVVQAAAAGLVSQVRAPRPLELCEGGLTAVVKFRADARLYGAMQTAAGAHGMSFGGWVRDGLAAMVGEHQARRPAAGVDAWTAVGRATALVVQASVAAVDRGEHAAAAEAEAALVGARDRLRGCGHTPRRRTGLRPRVAA